MDADLHMHTTASDGTDTVEKRVNDAKNKDISCIAITDHDTINTDLEQRKKEVAGVKLVTGSEIKASLRGEKIEILGYFLDPSDSGIQNLFERIKEYREERMRKMVDRVNELVDTTVELDEVLEKAEASVGRPHLARTLVEKGIVEDMGDAFGKYIANGGPAYVPGGNIDAEKVIDVIHKNGGVASLAHPGKSLKKENAYSMVEELVKKGLDAIEVSYTYDIQDREFSFGVEKAMEIAENLDLLITGGSDCHGSESYKYFLGEVRFPYKHVKKLWEKSKEYRD